MEITQAHVVEMHWMARNGRIHAKPLPICDELVRARLANYVRKRGYTLTAEGGVALRQAEESRKFDTPWLHVAARRAS